jgi:hypothetical protein
MSNEPVKVGSGGESWPTFFSRTPQLIGPLQVLSVKD